MNDLAEPVSDSEPRDNETHEGPADGPPPVAWLQRRAERIDGNEGTAASWERLRPHDEKALEALWAEDGSSTPLFGGRWEAHLTVGTHGPRGAADATSPTPLALPRTESAAEADSSAADEEREAEAARAISVGCLRARYYAESERALVRSIWCYRSWPNGVWRPFARQDDVALDAMWRSMVRGQATSECGYVTEDGLYDIRIKRQPADGELLVVMRAVGEPSWNPLKRLSWYARRGWAGDKLPPLSAAEVEYEERPAEALVLVVHGMGEAVWSSGSLKSIGSIRDGCAAMRSHAAALAAAEEGDDESRKEDLRTVLKLAGYDDAKVAAHSLSAAPPSSAPPPAPTAAAAAAAALAAGRRYEGGGTGVDGGAARGGRVEFLPAEWHTCLREEGDGTFATLQSVTQRSVPFLRKLANDVVMDVIFYQQDSHRRRMLSFVASRLNDIVRRWRQNVPRFDGPIVLLGHSLGSLICFDLLDTPLVAAAPAPAPPDAPPAAPPAELDFTPAAFVGLGSPVGCFAALRGASLGPSFSLARCGTYFNVYHRNDVVAYRIEPLLLPPGAAARPAAYVPYSGGADGQRLHVKVKQTVRSVQKAVTGIGAAAASSASAVGSWFNSSLSEKVLAATAALDAAARPRSAAADGSADAEGGSDGAGGAADQATREYALNGGEPIDWVLQETELEAANEYLSAAQAHTGYFDNPDVAAFMVRHVVARQAPQRHLVHRVASSGAT